MARPEIEPGDTEVSSDRIMGSRGLSGAWSGGVEIHAPGLRGSGYEEDLPAIGASCGPRAVEAPRYWALKAGLRVTGVAGIAGTGLVPDDGVSLARAVTRSSLDDDKWVNAPRAAIGLAGSLGAGALAADLSGGSLLENIQDLRFGLSCVMNF